MKLMAVHPNFPAQFGHILHHLTTQLGWECTFVTSVDTTKLALPFNHVNYGVGGKPVADTFFNPDTEEELKEHMKSLYVGLRDSPHQFKPDLVVGHMSYGTMLYLKNLYPEAKFVGYFEILPGDFWTDKLTLRKEFPAAEAVRIFNATYHYFTHLHLNVCDACYTPTQYQYQTCPPEWRHKLRVIHDGIDCDFFSRKDVRGSTATPVAVEFRWVTIRPETKVITYVSRGLESARGFDIFMRAAKKVYQAVPDVLFLVVGGTRTNYGHEGAYLSNTTFKDWVLAQDEYDLSKFAFLGHIPPTDLKTLFDLSDLHVYLTAPYVLSWSLLQAMANGCVVLGSKTAPVEEVIEDNWTGLLADFYDADALAERAIAVLRSPAPYRYLGDSAAEMVRERYEKTKCVNQLVKFFGEVVG